MKLLRRLIALTLTLGLLAGSVLAGEAADLAKLTAETAAYVQKTVAGPAVGSIGGEWAVLGLARSGADVPDSYFQDYIARAEAYVAEKEGALHRAKYTEYSRLIVALSALGKDARDVAGYDLTAPLGDFDKTVWQGINGPAWALLALDCANYPMPEGTATRQRYVDYLLERRDPNGGWSLTQNEETSDPDVTGMVLQALARYTSQPAVAAAVEEALACMSALQKEDGGFGSWGTDTTESTVQVLVALCELGIPLEDERFVKKGNTVLDGLLVYRQADGSFTHDGESGENLMSTEQGLYGLAAALRAQNGQPSLYAMTDALTLPDGEKREGTGLPGKDPAVAVPPVSAPNADFADLAGLPQADAVKALAVRGILNGYDDGLFHGQDGLDRAQFAAMVVRSLGLEPETVSVFSDVADNAWYAPFVGTAYTRGIVNGTGGGTFTPNGSITRQEAAVMVARAAVLCGLDTELDDLTVRDILAGQFIDYVTAAAWARPALAFCCREGILDTADMELRPAEPVSRAEVAGMLHALLVRAELL